MANHGVGDETAFALPSIIRTYHCSNQLEVGILLLQGLQFIQISGVLRGLVAIEQMELLWRSLLRGMFEHAVKRRDANAACNKHGGYACVCVQHEVAGWAGKFNFAADWHRI